jgi:hypothetical protein
MQLIPVQDPQDRTVAGSGNGSAQAALSGLVIRVKFPCGTGLLAIKLFRHESQPGFSDEEIDHVRCASPLILACVERHVALHRPKSTGRGTRHASPG